MKTMFLGVNGGVIYRSMQSHEQLKPFKVGPLPDTAEVRTPIRMSYNPRATHLNCGHL